MFFKQYKKYFTLKMNINNLINKKILIIYIIPILIGIISFLCILIII